MPQGKVSQVGQVKFSRKGDPYFTLKIDNIWYSLPGGEQQKAQVENQQVSYTITKPASGNYNAWIKVDAVAPEPEPKATERPSYDNSNGNGHGGISWVDYRDMAMLAHGLAKELEPDVASSDVDLEGRRVITPEIDRATARAAILNTVMIAFSNGKISLPDEDESPF